MDSGDTMGRIPQPTRALSTVSEIIASISLLQSKEAQLSLELADVLSDRASLMHSVSCLQSLIPQLDELRTEALTFYSAASGTAKTAQHVGGHVRSLDEEMRRVREAAERVSQVMDLKSALAALEVSIDQKDWEAATRHCARAMSLPTEVIAGPFAEVAVPTSENHLPPAQTLQAMREELLATFQREFERASQSRDAAATSRFFKLFPAIGWEAEGLEAYSAFVVDLVRLRAPPSAKTSSPLYYITALTALFENIAVIIDQHQPIVEKYYGLGKMTHVLERLLREADGVVKALIEGWEEERSIKRKVNDAKDHPPKGGSIALVARQPSYPSEEDDDRLDPRDIDRVLSEIVGITGRWSLFRKFMFSHLKEDDIITEDAAIAARSAQAGVPSPAPVQDHSGALAVATGLEVVENCASRQLFEDILSQYYVPLEIWYTRTVLYKALRASSADATQSPTISTMPDDVFFILKVVLMRSLSCGSTTVVQKAVEHLRDIMDHDYVGTIKKNLDEVYRTTSTGARGERTERENRRIFIILLNDLDVSASYMERLMQELVALPMLDQYFLDSETELVRRTVLAYTNTISKLRSALRAGIEQLFNQLMRPRLRTFIQDVYKDVSYVLDEETYAAAGEHDTVRKRFVKAWESLIDGYKDIFTENNYRLFFGLVLDVLVRPWERLAMTFRFNELGAIRFDQDLRSILSYLSSQTIFGDVREKFVRLQQMAILLNLDSDEDVDEFYNGSGVAWQLGVQEARSIAGLRS